MSTTKANDSLSTANVDSESSLWAAAVAVGLPLYVYVCVCIVIVVRCEACLISFFFGIIQQLAAMRGATLIRISRGQRVHRT